VAAVRSVESILKDISDPTVEFGQVVAAILRADETVRLACFARIAEMLGDGAVDRRRRGALLASHLTLPASSTSLLAAALSDSDEHVRFGAAWALVRQRGDAIGALEQLLLRFEDDHTPTRDRALWAVSNIGAPAVTSLLGVLTDPSVSRRAAAVYCLGNIVSIPSDRANALSDAAARSLAGALLGAVGDPEAWVRLCAVDAISRLQRRFILPAMIELLGSGQRQVREQAALYLCWASPQLSEEAIGALERLLNDENSMVRHFAAEGMRRMGRMKEAGGG
jgi:HEAT repeat protein